MWHVTLESHYHSFKQAPFRTAGASPSARFSAPRGRVRLRLPPGSARSAQSARIALRVARHATRHSDESMTFVGLRPSPLRRPPLPICSQPSHFGAMPPFAQPRADAGRRRSPRLHPTPECGNRVPRLPSYPSSASTALKARRQRIQTAGCRGLRGIRSARGQPHGRRRRGRQRRRIGRQQRIHQISVKDFSMSAKACDRAIAASRHARPGRRRPGKPRSAASLPRRRLLFRQRSLYLFPGSS